MVQFRKFELGTKLFIRTYEFLSTWTYEIMSSDWRLCKSKLIFFCNLDFEIMLSSRRNTFQWTERAGEGVRRKKFRSITLALKKKMILQLSLKAMGV